jgi:hypothetical protein
MATQRIAFSHRRVVEFAIPHHAQLFHRTGRYQLTKRRHRDDFG